MEFYWGIGAGAVLYGNRIIHQHGIDASAIANRADQRVAENPKQAILLEQDGIDAVAADPAGFAVKLRVPFRGGLGAGDLEVVTGVCDGHGGVNCESVRIIAAQFGRRAI